MTNVKKDYPYARKTVLLSALFMFLPTVVLTMVFIRMYQVKPVYALAPALPLALIFSALPQLLRDIFNLFSHKPAISLTPDYLVSNIDRRRYKWSDIKTISYKVSKRKTTNGYTEVTFTNNSKPLQIPKLRIAGEPTDFVSDLQAYHKQYARR